MNSLWPFPSTPASADDLPRPHVERDAAHGFEVTVVQYLQVLDAEEGLAGIDRRLLDPEQDLAADHQARKSLRIAPSRGTVSIFLPRRRTVMRSAISSTSRSL